jgi:hypothetical protein
MSELNGGGVGNNARKCNKSGENFSLQNCYLVFLLLVGGKFHSEISGS